MVLHAKSFRAHATRQRLRSHHLRDAHLEALTLQEELKNHKLCLKRNFYRHVNGKRVKTDYHAMSFKAHAMRPRLRSHHLRDAHQEWLTLQEHLMLQKVLLQKHQKPLLKDHTKLANGKRVRTDYHVMSFNCHAMRKKLRSHHSRDAHQEWLTLQEQPMLQKPLPKDLTKLANGKRVRMDYHVMSFNCHAMRKKPRSHHSRDAHQEVLTLQEYLRLQKLLLNRNFYQHANGKRVKMELNVMSFKAHATRKKPKSHHLRDAHQEWLTLLEEPMLQKTLRKLGPLLNTQHTLEVLQRILSLHQYALITRAKMVPHAIRSSPLAKNLERSHHLRDALLEALIPPEEPMPHHPLRKKPR